jgi:uncharacterized membrane-anchored protein
MQADNIEELGDARLSLRLRRIAQAERDIARDREMRKQRVVLEHHADATMFRGHGVSPATHGLAVQHDFAAIDGFETRDAAKNRRLAAAARTEQAPDRARLQLKRKVFEDRTLVVRVADVPHFEQC